MRKAERSVGSWSKQALEWTGKDKETVFMSVVFTWDLPAVYRRAVWLRQCGYKVVAGGPAVRLMPEYLEGVATCNPYGLDALSRHNSMATVTSRGCIRRCRFCAVPRVEGGLRELAIWPVRPVVCDNNLLACSRVHFDRVIDSLKSLDGVDFNQGLDARLLTSYHAGRLAELDCMVRLAFDSVAHESALARAYERLRRAGLPKARIRVYTLIGFEDTPEDALYRVRLIVRLGIDPSPMRYNPLDTLRRDSYVGPGWTAKELGRFVRYWSRLRFFRAVPFEQFERE